MPKKSDRDRFLDALDPDGQFRTNQGVREQLGLAPDRYWAVRNELLAQGAIIISRGQGGRVALKIPVEQLRARQAEPPRAQLQEEVAEVREEILEEAGLYEPFANSVRNRARDEGLEQTVVEVTARQGRRLTGRWSRPDVCQVSI